MRNNRDKHKILVLNDLASQEVITTAGADMFDSSTYTSGEQIVFYDVESKESISSYNGEDFAIKKVVSDGTEIKDMNQSLGSKISNQGLTVNFSVFKNPKAHSVVLKLNEKIDNIDEMLNSKFDNEYIIKINVIDGERAYQVGGLGEGFIFTVSGGEILNPSALPIPASGTTWAGWDFLKRYSILKTFAEVINKNDNFKAYICKINGTSYAQYVETDLATDAATEETMPNTFQLRLIIVAKMIEENYPIHAMYMKNRARKMTVVIKGFRSNSKIWTAVEPYSGSGMGYDVLGDEKATIGNIANPYRFDSEQALKITDYKFQTDPRKHYSAVTFSSYDKDGDVPAVMEWYKHTTIYFAGNDATYFDGIRNDVKSIFTGVKMSGDFNTEAPEVPTTDYYGIPVVNPSNIEL